MWIAKAVAATVCALALGAAAAHERRWRATLRDCDLVRLQALNSLRSGEALAPIREHAQALLTKLSKRAKGRGLRGEGEVAQLHAAVEELRAVLSILAMEVLDLEEAEDLVGSLTSETSRLRRTLLTARLSLWTGTSPRDFADGPTHALWMTLMRDTNAQIVLLRGGVPVETDVLPTTAARVRAASGDEDGARAILANLHPARREAMLRAYPADPASIAWSRRNSGPYR